MIERMRSGVAKVILQILAFFLILSFGVWGIGDIFRGRSAPTDVAEVAGVMITGQELNRAFRRTVDALRERFGPRFDSAQARQIGLLDQTLDDLIVERLFALEAATLGLDAGDDLIRGIIAADPAFHRGGRFDAATFSQALARRNLTEAGYVAALRADIVRQQLTRALTADDAVPKKLQELVYGYRNQKRVAEFVLLKSADATGGAEPTEVELTAFHKKYAARFTAPEYRNVTVVYFDPKVMAREIRISEKRLREEYEYRLPSLSVPERRELQQILVQDEALAERVHQSLREGREFSKVATEIAKRPEGSLTLGWLTRNELPKDIADAAFAPAEGGVSEPVKSALGWHILRVVKIEGGKAPSFEEARKAIAADLAGEKAVDALIGVANKFEDALAGGASLEEATAKAGVALFRIAAIDARGRDPGGKPAKRAPGDPNFVQTIFATATGATSTLTETSDGGFFMVRIDSITPPVLRPLAAVRSKVVTVWKLVQRDEQVKKRAEALMARAKATGSLQAAAKENDLTSRTSKPFTRFNLDPASQMPESLVQPLFTAKQGGLAMSPYDQGYAVARLKDIKSARPEADGEAYRNLGKSLRTAMAQDFVDQFTDALRQRYTVSIDRRAVEALF